MTVYIGRLIGKWNDSAGGNDMQVALDHPFPGVSYSDATGQPNENIPPDTNLVVVEFEGVDDTQLSALESAYAVLWSDPLPLPDGSQPAPGDKSSPSAGEMVVKADKQALKADLEALGADAVKLDALIKDNDPQDARTIEGQLIAYFAELKKEK